jgi:hypothetical protein
MKNHPSLNFVSQGDMFSIDTKEFPAYPLGNFTINRADFLISWNFKHIVNIQRIRGYNSINLKNGYKLLEIRSPREFKKYEDD